MELLQLVTRVVATEHNLEVWGAGGGGGGGRWGTCITTAKGRKWLVLSQGHSNYNTHVQYDSTMKKLEGGREGEVIKGSDETRCLGAAAHL